MIYHMYKYSWLFLAILVFANTRFAVAQDKFTVNGFVTDQASGEKLINATVYVPGLKIGTVSNSYGFYSITLPKDSIQLIFSFTGYEAVHKTQYLDQNIRLDIALETNNILNEVEIVAENNDLHATEMSVHRIDMQTVKTSPALGGETDVMKVLQLLPGVKIGSEGSSGLYVRGGSPDQNLILLDGVPVYNVSHLFGFLSVFNTDALHNVNLIKGGIPARYGGRLSSVLDISMKEGNLKEGKGVFSLSPIVGKLTYEAPIIKNKAAFIVSGRKSWLGELLFPEKERYGLYDLNVKVNTIVNNTNRLYLSVYSGRDKYIRNSDGDSFGFNWGNFTAVTRWNRIFNAKLFGNLSAYYSKYAYAQKHKFDQNGVPNLLRTSSEINEWSLNGDFDYQPNVSQAIKFGFKAASLQFSPEVVRTQGADTDTTYNKEDTHAIQSSLYLEDEFAVGDRFTTNLGLRGSLYSVNAQNYWNLQPRLSTRYLVSNSPGRRSLSIKASYSYMVQYLHLLTNSSLGLPTDLWVSSTEKTKPETSWQVVSGMALSLDNNIEFTVEGYYKYMENLIEYAEGANYLFGTSNHWEDKIVAGNGEAYGAEFFLKKSTGRLNGWLGYTLSKTDRWFDKIDNGNKFPFKYDRRHDVSLLANYHLTGKKSTQRVTAVQNFFSLVFTFNTGNAVSFPEAIYKGENLPDWFDNNAFDQREYIAKRNNFRMPSYHRMDLSFSNEKQKNKVKRTWTFSIYNVYNRLNAYFLYESKGKIKQVSLFPIIPSVTCKIEF